MGLKAITPVQFVINSASASGLSGLISSVTDIRYKDSLAVQVVWSGNLQGVCTIDGSLNYSSGLPNSQSGGANNGDWVSLILSNSATSFNVGSSTQFPVLVNLNQLSFPFMRVTYTNSTGSGLISVYVAGKSLG